MYKTFDKKGKLTANIAEETHWNKLCVYPTGPYKIDRKGK